MVGTGMTREKLERIAAASRTGGNVRRRHKAVRKTSEPEDTKLQGTFRKMGMTPIDVNEVDITMESGDVIRFTNSKVCKSFDLISSLLCLLY